MLRVLIMEDEMSVGEVLKEVLEEEGWEIVWTKSISETRNQIKRSDFQLFLFDVNLPDGNGFDLLKTIQMDGNTTPVIFLTARVDEESVLKGLTFGAVDYLRKPYSKRELVLKAHRILNSRQNRISVGELTLDPSRRTLAHGSVDIPITQREFTLLHLLLQKPNELVSRESMLSSLAWETDLEERSITSYMSRLKKRLESAGVTGVQIQSVYGVGYRLEFESKKKVG